MSPLAAVTATGLSLLLIGCATPIHTNRTAPPAVSHFIGLTDFSSFTESTNQAPGGTILTSPEIDPRIAWDELVVSWNLRAADAGLKVEARGIYPDHRTKFYTLGLWSADPARHPRESVNGQRDTDGDVRTDTLVLVRLGARVQVRLTFVGAGVRAQSSLDFLGLSFCDSHRSEPPGPPHRNAWGKSLPVPERSQLDYRKGRDWCSPTSVSMVLAYWANELHRTELDKDVPEVATGVNDPNWPGTGNWPFNTAFAGGFEGLRAYIVRLTDVSELEDWIAVGVPVIVSVSPGLLNGEPDLPDTGHLVVCDGFTRTGDVIMNDPWAHRDRGQHVRRVYLRRNLVAGWKRSHNTAYLIYPTTAKIPRNRLGHWAGR